MSTFFDTKKLTELSIGLFGTLTVYTIYGIIYERLIMLAYQNDDTKVKQFFVSSAGFVLVERGIAWILTEICCFLWKGKQQIQQRQTISRKYNIICGFLIFLSAILFVHGIYTTSYRYSFVMRTGVFAGASILGYVFSLFRPFKKSPKLVDIIFSLGILGGAILFWVLDSQICFYVPIQPRVIANVLMIVSCLTDGGLSIVQKMMVEEYKPKVLTMMRDISRWTMACSLVYVAVIGDLPYTISFLSTHKAFTFDIILLSLLFFISQLFIYRAIIHMAQNIPSYFSSVRKILNVQVSYAFSVHSYHKYQVVGMVIAWVSILLQAIFIVRKEKKEVKSGFRYSYDQMTEVTSDDGDGK